MWDAGHPQEGFQKQSGTPDPVFVPSHCLPGIMAFRRTSHPRAWHHKYLLNEQMKECRGEEGRVGEREEGVSTQASYSHLHN